MPGDIVKICGIVKVSDADEKGRNKEKSMFLLYVFANSVENCKSQQTSDSGSEIDMEFSLKVNQSKVKYYKNDN